MIIINYEPFGTSTLFYDENKCQMNVPSNIYELSESIFFTAYASNDYEVKCNAPEVFLEKIIQLVQEKEQKEYSKNKIKIERI